MEIISNNLIGKIPIDAGTIIRVNLAWFHSILEAENAIKKIHNNIYLDYPSGRTKPPMPKITLSQAIHLCHKIRPAYFAISNVEDGNQLLGIRRILPAETELVPKIETVKGVREFKNIVRISGIKIAMLDKEDLYTNDSTNYESNLAEIRRKAKEMDVKLLELAGVVFI